MVEITLFEIHLENSTFDAEATANAPLSRLFGGDDVEEEQAAENGEGAETGTGGSGGPGSIGKLLVAALALAALAAVARRFLSEEDLDDIVETAEEQIELETGTAEAEADD